MDSYLANIDVYMQERQQQIPASATSTCEQQQTTQQMSEQPTTLHASIPSTQHQQPQQLPFHDIWLNSIHNLSPSPVYNVYNEYPSSTPVTTLSDQNTFSTNSHPPSEHIETPITHTLPIKHKKKPGRKPNPASPALRKAQNRAAQRAFRERKERHLRELETTIRNLRDQNRKLKSQLDAYKTESWYLRGIVLTLQFVCMYYQITIPTHSPYMTEEDLIRLMEKSPRDVDMRATEAYLEACRRNNKDIQSIYEFVNEQQRSNHVSSMNGATTSSMDDISMPMESTMNHGRTTMQMNEGSCSSVSDAETNGRASSTECEQRTTSERVQEQQSQDMMRDSSTSEENEQSVNDNIKAIQQIRLQLGVQAVLSNASTPNQSAVTARLKPTLLQLSVPHDPRIDLIPTPHTRDRFIIFRDQFVVGQKECYDKCFNMLLNGAVFHGGDPTLSECWELPEEYFSEYWFLTINYDDVKGTNKWRRQKGLCDVSPGPVGRTATDSHTAAMTSVTSVTTRNPMPTRTAM
ncbi:hypothetical protein BDF20DRAFT_303911 [Mycotypha africana]|uniref:uncharacterized protein n=1 Tax=Mycotypha africana TaxID=64632 RepID=UPI002301E26A|nr:uncharacterized protein BDF20DRAFT_303911 [Mycotypha africana]KAI8988058.1 hypothetical protein BDF20DRAFT_303911 [Mycotypha africana]